MRHRISAWIVILLFGAMQSTPVALSQTAEPDAELAGLLRTAVEEADSFADRFAAEVWLKDMSQRMESRVPDLEERLVILRRVHHEAMRTRLSPQLVLAIIEVESSFDRFAISRVGAQGLMQIMPFWLEEIGHEEDSLFDIKINLRMGCTILRHYLNKEKNNYIRALGRYHGSLGSNRYPKLVMDRLEDNWYWD